LRAAVCRLLLRMPLLHAKWMPEAAR